MKDFRGKTMRCIDSRQMPCTPGPRNTVLCMVVSGVVGWTIGFALVEAIGSGASYHWELMAQLPLFNGIGWSLLGMIIGGSGLFDRERMTRIPVVRSYLA